MGCGISTLGAEDTPLNQRSKDYHHHGDEGKDGVMIRKPLGGDEEAKDDEGSNGERLKEKSVVERNNKEEEKVFDIGGKEKHNSVNEKCAKNINVEEKHEDNNDSFVVGPSSPSFREYCNEYDCGDRSSMGNSNDYKSSMESIKNGNDSIRKNKPKDEGSVNSNKEHEKKERRGRGFRNVINKGKSRGRRNLLNLVCYNSNNESCAEGSFNKIGTKTA